MLLNRLEINNFRNIHYAEFVPGASFNLIYGINGAGKTSLLEAIYYLFTAKSFRSQMARHIINHGADSFLLFGQLCSKDGVVVPVGLEKSRLGSAKIKVEGVDDVSRIELARRLPLQLLTTQGYRLLEEGPKYRRHFLDWGLFHVEQNFIGCWQRMTKLIRQRNAALKTKNRKEVIIWDEELIKCADIVHKMRIHYLGGLKSHLEKAMGKLLQEFELQLEYCPGWNTDFTFREELERCFAHDLVSGNTSVGPHRADLNLTIDSVPIKDLLSRGQQKMVLFALRLAQGLLHKELTTQTSAYLIDDFPSELDSTRRERVVAILKEMQAQSFITGIDREDLELFSASDSKMFHVEQGNIIPEGC